MNGGYYVFIALFEARKITVPLGFDSVLSQPRKMIWFLLPHPDPRNKVYSKPKNCTLPILSNSPDISMYKQCRFSAMIHSLL